MAFQISHRLVAKYIDTRIKPWNCVKMLPTVYSGELKLKKSQTLNAGWFWIFALSVYLSCYLFERETNSRIRGIKMWNYKRSYQINHALIATFTFALSVQFQGITVTDVSPQYFTQERIIA